MKRSLAITATTAMLALSLAGCGTQRNGDVDLLPDFDGDEGTTATDTVRNNNGTDTVNGTASNNGMTGTTVNGGTGTTNNAGDGTGLGSVTGAVNRGTTQYGTARYGTVNNGYNGTYGVGGPNSGAYTSTNNGGLTTMNGGMSYANEAAVKRAAAEGDRYARMLENGRVHDRDGFLLDGENASYRTY